MISTIVFIWSEAGNDHLRVLKASPGPDKRYLLIEREQWWWAALITGSGHWQQGVTLTQHLEGESFDSALLRCHSHWAEVSGNIP